MKSTKDYSIFKEITSNREVDLKHVKRLVTSIEDNNLLHLNPIIVNAKMQIIDGQHRLEAARKLGVEIFYIESDEVSKDDIATLNSVSKKWSPMDYVNHFTIEQRQGFQKLSMFLNKAPNLGLTTALMLVSRDGKRDMQALREGDVDVENIDAAYTIIGLLDDLARLYDYDFIYDRSFISAFMKAYHARNFNFEYLKSKVIEFPRSLVRCRKTSEYIKMIEEIYNYKLSKNRIKI